MRESPSASVVNFSDLSPQAQARWLWSPVAVALIVGALEIIWLFTAPPLYAGEDNMGTVILLTFEGNFTYAAIMYGLPLVIFLMMTALVWWAALIRWQPTSWSGGIVGGLVVIPCTAVIAGIISPIVAVIIGAAPVTAPSLYWLGGAVGMGLLILLYGFLGIITLIPWGLGAYLIPCIVYAVGIAYVTWRIRSAQV